MQKSTEPGGVSETGVFFLQRRAEKLRHSKLIAKMASTAYRRSGGDSDKFNALNSAAVHLALSANSMEPVIITAGGLLCLVAP